MFCALWLGQAVVGQSYDIPSTLAVAVTPDGRSYVPGEILVLLSPEADRELLLRRVAGRPEAVVGHVARLRALKLRTAEGAEQAAIEFYASLPGVLAAELDWLGQAAGLVPDDTFFFKQWHLDNTGQGGGTPGADIQASDAWGITRGSESVVVAILDSGIDFTHPEFAGRLLPGYDFVNEDDDPTADNPHGVWTTGLLAAATDNGFGVAGVDWRCRILPVKMLNANGGGTTFDLVQALDYSVAMGAEIVSMSLAGYPPSALLQAALKECSRAGVILFAAAGNSGPGTADTKWPGASPATISIGFTDRWDILAGLSGTGQALDFVAPGKNVTTVHEDAGAPASEQFTVGSGSSAATPIAAGIVALLKSVNPDLTQSQAYELLKVGAEDQVGPADKDLPGWDENYGHGRLNAFRSLQALCGCTEAMPFVSSPQEISVSAGGVQRLSLDAGFAEANAAYWILGSASGVSPGATFGGARVPLNADGWFAFLLGNPNTVIRGSLAELDADGRGAAAFRMEPGAPPALVGRELHHAFVTFRPGSAGGSVGFVSNTARLRLVP